MSSNNFSEVVQLICNEDSRYDKGAYYFLRHALDSTLSNILEREKSEKPRHVTGQELCEGIKEYALDQFGPMAGILFKNWGITGTEDFGQIVFNLVEYGIFGKTETDSIEDFNKVYEFEEVFEKPFRPQKPLASNQSQSVSNPT